MHADAGMVVEEPEPAVVGEAVVEVEVGAVAEVDSAVVKGLEKPTVDVKLLVSQRFFSLRILLSSPYQDVLFSLT